MTSLLNIPILLASEVLTYCLNADVDPSKVLNAKTMLELESEDTA